METHDLSAERIVEAVDGVYLAELSVGANMSVQHFHIQPGASVPEHSHPHEQVGFVYDGALTFEVDGEEHVVTTGESYVIPADEPHAAHNVGDTPVDGIDVFSPPRENPDWQE
ncbi:cupin domain-containing protein [Salarchaeum japonicum]|uniref:cupin domain-containing protein n=1 Tax=Salarchaeum japonicum TaxID=555573 RepID=UPI003C71C7DD